MNPDIHEFLSGYGEKVREDALQLRDTLLAAFPGIQEQLDLPARMIAYGYGQRYTDLICTIIPSQKGLKLGFNRGIDLPDPAALLEGSGKISRYVVIRSAEQMQRPEMQALLEAASEAYRQRTARP